MRIQWTGPAAHDFVSICNYTQEQYGPAVASKKAQHIIERVDSLVQFPKMGRSGRKSGTRELVLSGSPFLAVYRIREKCD